MGPMHCKLKNRDRQDEVLFFFSRRVKVLFPNKFLSMTKIVCEKWESGCISIRLLFNRTKSSLIITHTLKVVFLSLFL